MLPWMHATLPTVSLALAMSVWSNSQMLVPSGVSMIASSRLL